MTSPDYAAQVAFNDEEGIFTWRIADRRDGMGFHADRVKVPRTAVEDYLETCAKPGKDPQRAYSDQMMLRPRPEAASPRSTDPDSFQTLTVPMAISNAIVIAAGASEETQTFQKPETQRGR